MTTKQSRTALVKDMRTVWFIWLAMLATLGVYLFLCLWFEEALRTPQRMDFPLEMMKNALAIAALITIAAAVVMRRFMFKAALRSADSSQDANSHPIARYTVVVIITLAIAESVGIYGLILFMLGASYQTLYTFLFISALMMLWHRPKLEEYEALAAKWRN